MRIPLALGVALVAAAAITVIPHDTQAALPVETWGNPTSSPNGTALAMDQAGKYIIAGYLEKLAAGSRTPANLDFDCELMEFETGRKAVLPDDSEILDGIEAVAMSGDGNFSACGAGYDGSVGGLPVGSGVSTVTDLWFFDNRKIQPFPEEEQRQATPVESWKLVAEWTKQLPGTVNALAINWDGTIVLVGTGRASLNSSVYAFNKQGDTLWTFKTKGSVLSVAMNSTGEWMVAGARRNEESGPDQGKPFGEVLLFNDRFRAPVEHPAPGSRLLFNHTIKETAGGDITSISISEDGKKILAGTAGGKLYYFRNGMDANGNGAVSTPQIIDIGRPVHFVKIARNGSHAVVGDGSFVGLYTFERDLLVRVWQDQVFSPVVSADITPDGKYIFAGGASTMRGYINESAQYIWDIPGQGARVAISYYNNNVTRLGAAPGTGGEGGLGRLLAFTLHYDTRLIIVNDERVPFEVIPGAENHIAVQVRNNGSSYESYEVTIGNASGLGVTPNLTTFSLRPTTDAVPTDVEVNMTLIPDFVLPGVYRYNVSVYAKESNTTTNVTVNVSVIPQNKLELRVPGGDAGGKPGDRITALVTVKNLGNDRQVVTFIVDQKPPGRSNWSIRLEPETVSVQPGASASLNAIITIPASAADGDINTVTLTGYAAEAVAKAQFKVIVNPLYDVRIEASPPTRIINPGRTATIAITITNSGTLEDSFAITQRLEIVGIPGWTPAFDKNPVSLGRSTSVTRDLTVRAPDAATVGDRLAVSVEVVGAGGSKDAVTAHFNAEPAAAPPIPNPVPTPGAAGVIGLTIAALVASALRSRAGGGRVR